MLPLFPFLFALLLPSSLRAQTVPNQPSYATISIVGQSSITFNWNSNGNSQGTIYTVLISTAPDPALPEGAEVSTTTTFQSTATIVDLLLNTTYFLQVEASNASGQASDFTAPLETSTLANPPTGFAFLEVSYASMTFQWAANGNSTTTVYSLSYWQPTGSTTSVYITAGDTITAYDPIISTNVLPYPFGFNEGSTYYFTLGAINNSGTLSSLGVVYTTITPTLPLTSAIIGPSGGTLALPNGPGGPITLNIPSGVLTQVATVTLAVPVYYPIAPSSVGNLTATSVGAQVIANPAIEPLGPYQISVSYQASQVGGLNKSQLVLARFDPNDDLWVPLISSVNTSEGTVSASPIPFGLVQIMQNAPSTAVKTAVAYPNPWRMSSSSAPDMTFSLMPPNARVRVYTIDGLLVKNLTADTLGVATWDGTNQSGRKVATGFYFVFIQGSGQETTLKAIVQR